MQARKIQKIGFAVSFMVAVLGAVLLLISQMPQTREYYDMVDTHSFSDGEPLTFPWTSEAGVKFRFEVKGVDWMSQPPYSHHLSLREDYLSSTDDEPAEPPWVWYVSVSKWAFPMTANATFWHYEDGSKVIDRATTSASVEISRSRETTYRLTYLSYMGLPLLIIGAILTPIIGNEIDSRMGFLVFQSGWARLRTELKIFLATFLLAFVVLFIIHLVYLPYYWANASSQQGRPIDLYLPNVWTPGIAFISVLIAVILVVAYSLLSWLRKGKPGEASVEGVIFVTTFFLGCIGIYVLAALAGLQFGHTMRLSSGQSPKSGFAFTVFTFYFSSVGAVSSVIVFDFYKLVRWTRKRLKLKAET